VSTDHNAPKEDVKKKIDKAETLIKEVTNDNQKKGKDSNESKLEEALVILSDACNRDANMSKAFYLRAKCHYHFGDFQRALYDFSVAIRIELDNPNHKKSTIAEY
jgi:tetratricopeptide (TPR) repeat protein